MGYHDRDIFEKRWQTPENTAKTQSENPRIQIISPQKKLIDIRAELDKARENPVSMYELHTAIQRILDGE